MEQGGAASLLNLLRTRTMTSAGLIAILALTFYLRLLYFGQYIDADVGNVGYVAWRMAEGEILIDLEGPGKPPLYSMLYAVFIRLFGTSVLGLKMFGTFFVLLAVIAVYWVAKQAYGKQVGLLAALLFGVFSSGPMVEGGTVNLETVLHFPYILAIGFFLKASMSGRLRWYFLAGLCAALATLVKQIGGVLFFIFLCYGIYERWRKNDSLPLKQWLSRYVLLGGGALLPVMGVIIFYHFHGYTLSQLYDSMLGSNLRYIQRGHELNEFTGNFFFQTERHPSREWSPLGRYYVYRGLPWLADFAWQRKSERSNTALVGFLVLRGSLGHRDVLSALLPSDHRPFLCINRLWNCSRPGNAQNHFLLCTGLWPKV